ncbi:MAG: DUF4331 domain-containing protein [bacterium]
MLTTPSKSRKLLFAATTFFVSSVMASSHMDAPLISKDDTANTTDVYAFVSENNGVKYLTTALAVNPFEEPGIGPNAYDFDDRVRYEIHLSMGNALSAGARTVTYRFEFNTEYKTEETILQSYLGVVEDIDDGAQNRTQTYTVSRIDYTYVPFLNFELASQPVVLGSGVVPPNNEGIATPYYNMEEDGEMMAKDGVSSGDQLDRYTSQAIATLDGGYQAFAGQRDDGFYGDIQAIFDLLNLRTGDDHFDSQAGYNVHTIALNIPMSEIGGDQQIVGVFATTSRQAFNLDGSPDPDHYVQVGRQGNPLFNEALVSIKDKDLYNRTLPTRDAALFGQYATNPELASLINALIFGGQTVALDHDRADIYSFFIPDVIKVDLSTQPARLAGSGAEDTNNPDDEGFSRLGIFGGDVLTSTVQEGFGDGTVPGGWPNGRRFGDDVIDIAVTALISDLRDGSNLIINVADGIDNVNANDIGYNKVFPYAATPLNGRNHKHH